MDKKIEEVSGKTTTMMKEIKNYLREICEDKMDDPDLTISVMTAMGFLTTDLCFSLGITEEKFMENMKFNWEVVKSISEEKIENPS
jgi:hypothetical protein